MAVIRKWLRHPSCDVIDSRCSNIMFVVVVMLSLAGSTQSDEYCQWETFNATCAHNHVILITSAVYGRMRVGRCVPYDYFVGCSTEVYDQLAARCSGRQHCSVPIPDTELFKVHPCRKDLVAYMEASYQCVPVAGAPVRSETSTSLTPCDGEVSLTGPSGYLSATIARRTGYGSQRCPWVVRVPVGQYIELTVYDFGLDVTAASATTSAASGAPSSSGGAAVGSAAASGTQQRQSQQQQQHKVTSHQNSVLVDHQTSSSHKQQQQQQQHSAMASFDNIDGHVHCHVVAVYYEGDSRSTSAALSATKLPRNTSALITVARTSPTPTAIVSGAAARGKTNTAKSGAVEPHHLKLCPTIAGQSSGRGASITPGGPLDHRKKVVYTTTSNQLFIYTPNMTTNHIKHHYVMLRYDVIGCPDPELPPLTWMFRRGETVTVFCNQTAERWHLVCKANSWIGTYSNCTRTVASHRPEQPQKYVRNFPLGLLVAIAIGVISGVVVGFILLIAIFTCRKRFHDSVVRNPPTTEHSVLLVNYENRQNAYKLIDFKSAGATTTDHYTSTILQNGSPTHWPPPPGMMTSLRYQGGAVNSDPSSMYGCSVDHLSSRSPPMSMYCDESTLPDIAVSPMIGLDTVDEEGNMEAEEDSGVGGSAALHEAPSYNIDSPNIGQSPPATAVVVYPTDIYVTRELLRLNESPRRVGTSGGNGSAQSGTGCQNRNRHHQCYQPHLPTTKFEFCHGRAGLSCDRCCTADDPDVQQSIYGAIYHTSSTMAPPGGSSVNDCCSNEMTAGCH